MTCDTCGKALAVGDFPFCPHEPTKLSIVGDDVPGGFWVENGFDSPRKFYSKSEHVAALAARGCEIRAKWAGPHDTIMSNWAAGTVNLDAATELVSRPRRKQIEVNNPELLHVEQTVTILPETFRVEVDA